MQLANNWQTSGLRVPHVHTRTLRTSARPPWLACTARTRTALRTPRPVHMRTAILRAPVHNPYTLHAWPPPSAKPAEYVRTHAHLQPGCVGAVRP
jgi:hypothetical protein